MRVLTALLLCLGMIFCGPFIFRANFHDRAQRDLLRKPLPAIGAPPLQLSNTSARCTPRRAPARSSKTARRARAQSCRSSAAASKARVSRRRYRRRPATGSPTVPTAATGSMFASHSKPMTARCFW